MRHSFRHFSFSLFIDAKIVESKEKVGKDAILFGGAVLVTGAILAKERQNGDAPQRFSEAWVRV